MDAGLSARQIKKRMNEVGHDPKDLDYILVTHEHSDHVKGIPQLVKKYGIRIVSNIRTFNAIRSNFPSPPVHVPFETGLEFHIGGLDIIPASISHDAVDPVSYIIVAGDVKVAVITDLGFVSEELFEHLSGLDVLILEANHDMDMLMGGPYPLFLKKRICSLTGHLSNLIAADAILRTAPKKGSHILLAHISETNNHPDIAYSSVREKIALQHFDPGNLHLTYQDRPTELFQVPR